MPIVNLTFDVPFDPDAPYASGTLGKWLSDLADAIVTASIPDGSIVAVKLASDSVTTVKIVNGNVTTAKLADDAVTWAKIQNVSAEDRILGRITAGAGDIEEITLTAYARGTVLGSANQGSLHANMNLEIGVDVQAWAAKLDALAALTWAADKAPYYTGAGTVATYDQVAQGRSLAGSGQSKDLASTDNLQTGTTYTLVVAAGSTSDSGRMIRCTNAGAVTVTLPNSAPVGFYCSVYQGGAGQVIFSAEGGGSLVNRQSHTKLAGQHAGGGLKVWANAGGAAAQWTLTGDTAA